MNTRVMDLDNKMILIHLEQLGSLDSNPMGLNDMETPVHQGPLGFLTTNSLEKITSLPIIWEIAAFNTKGEPISAQSKTQIRNRNRKAHRSALQAHIQCRAELKYKAVWQPHKFGFAENELERQAKSQTSANEPEVRLSLNLAQMNQKARLSLRPE